MSHIQISYTLLYKLGMLVKPFIAVLVLYSSSAGAVAVGASASALLVLGECLIYNGRGRAWASLWHGHAPGSAMLLVPDNFVFLTN